MNTIVDRRILVQKVSHRENIKPVVTTIFNLQYTQQMLRLRLHLICVETISSKYKKGLKYFTKKDQREKMIIKDVLRVLQMKGS